MPGVFGHSGKADGVAGGGGTSEGMVVTWATGMGPRGRGEDLILTLRIEGAQQGFEQCGASCGCWVERGLPGAGREQEDQSETVVAPPGWRQQKWKGMVVGWREAWRRAHRMSRCVGRGTREAEEHL